MAYKLAFVIHQGKQGKASLGQEAGWPICLLSYVSFAEI
jgi:hypothetical protein